MFRAAIRSILISSVAFVLVPGSARAEEAKPAAKADTHVQKGELSDHMSDVEDLFKKLRRSIRKADAKTESIESITKITELLEKSKSLDPSWAAKLPEAKRAEFVAAYKQDIAATIALFAELRKTVEAGDTDKSQTIYKDIAKAQDAGHDKYIEEKKK